MGNLENIWKSNMRTLKESILDDDDEILTSTDKNFQVEIIEYIKQNYRLMNKTSRNLKIENYLKIDKDLTVNISTKTPTTLVPNISGIKNNNGELPTNGFKWGRVWNLNISDAYLRNFNNFPTSCNLLQIFGSFNAAKPKLKNLERIPIKCNILLFDGNINIDDLLGLENHKIELIEIYSNKYIQSIKGCPQKLNRLVLFNCANLKELTSVQISDLFIIQNCPKLTQSEKDKIYEI